MTMHYWGVITNGRVSLDSLAEERLCPQFDRVRWHRWLPDGSLVILNGDRLYRVHPSGDSRLLAAVGEPEVQPRLSPDGRWVAVALGRSVTFVPTAGGPVRRLPQPGWVHSIGWHPDSTRLAFNASNRICVAETGGAVETLRVEPVRRPAEWEGDAALWKVPQVEWSADGRLLAYRLILKSKNVHGEIDYETRLSVLGPRGKTWEHISSSFGQEDGLFSWALGGDVLAWTGTGGDVHSAGFLWTPRGSSEVVETGTEPTFYHTAWQPHGELLAVEAMYSAGESEMFGAASTFHDVDLVAIAGIPRGAAREDGWTEFEWAGSGSAFAAAVRARARVPDPKTRYYRLQAVGDFPMAGNPKANAVVQIAQLGGDVTDMQWQPGERAVTYVRQLGGRQSRLFSAAITHSAAGREEVRRRLAEGDASYRQGRFEDAAIHFRNAVRCAPDWSEPRVRLAQCYLDLSERETNPACMAWLLDGAGFELRRAGSLAHVSEVDERIDIIIAARRAHLNEALGVRTGERWSWDYNLSPRTPSWRPQPVELSPGE
ncbi:MAG: hypothetical protein JSV65_03005 [Armatimonadota bacterium]|nr:MAG: hypothetical protein JSV65_03005 [Armatimonadota bacterium]